MSFFFSISNFLWACILFSCRTLVHLSSSNFFLFFSVLGSGALHKCFYIWYWCSLFLWEHSTSFYLIFIRCITSEKSLVVLSLVSSSGKIQDWKRKFLRTFLNLAIQDLSPQISLLISTTRKSNRSWFMQILLIQTVLKCNHE